MAHLDKPEGRDMQLVMISQAQPLSEPFLKVIMEEQCAVFVYQKDFPRPLEFMGKC
jgi:hypothetical protein